MVSNLIEFKRKLKEEENKVGKLELEIKHLWEIVKKKEMEQIEEITVNF